MKWRRSPGEARHGKIETAPEEVNRADLAEKARAKKLEDAINLDHRPPEAVSRIGVVRRVDMIGRKSDRIWDLARNIVELDRDTEGFEQLQRLCVKGCN